MPTVDDPFPIDYHFTIGYFYPNLSFCCNENEYDTIEWMDTEIIPTDKELKEKWNSIKTEYYKNIFRNQRNRLLLNCDYKMVADFPFKEGERDQWILYRQALRDFINNYKLGDEFPNPP
jgi:hypothetical protein